MSAADIRQEAEALSERHQLAIGAAFAAHGEGDDEGVRVFLACACVAHARLLGLILGQHDEARRTASTNAAEPGRLRLS